VHRKLKESPVAGPRTHVEPADRWLDVQTLWTKLHRSGQILLLKRCLHCSL